MNYIGTEEKTIHGETVYRYSTVVQSKKEAKEIKHRLSEKYECVVEMSKYENIGFDAHTGREYPKSGLLYVFSIFPERS